MNKINNKGFIATTLIYSFLLLFATLVTVIITNYNYYRNTLNKYNKNINDALNAKVNNKYVTLYNEIDNSDFEAKYVSWYMGANTTNFSNNGNVGYDCNQSDCTNKNGSYQTNYTNAGGNNSFRFAPQTNSIVNSNVFSCIANNYYYISYDVFTSGALSGGNIGIYNNSGRFEVSESLNYGFQNWSRRGLIGKVSSGGNCVFRIDYQNSGGGADIRMNIDNVSVINITELLSKAGISIPDSGGNELKTKYSQALTEAQSDAKITHFNVSTVYDIDALKNTNNTTYNFVYTGSTQEFTAPSDGTYLLEVWGAQGGYQLSGRGGYGGYSHGEYKLNKGQKLYVKVGRGASEGYLDGGGATSIQNYLIGDGQLRNYKNNRGNVIIVAGGGGAGERENGGNGGGYLGGTGYQKSTGYEYYAEGGTQSSGGRGRTAAGHNNSGNLNGDFGIGGSGNSPTDSGPNGGEGYFGGGGVTYAGSGGGGSGYIGNGNLTNKGMYCYLCSESNDANTKTTTTSCYEETPTKNCAKLGHGYARITLIGAR